MKKYSRELSVGIFVFIGLLALGYHTIKLGKMEVFGSDARTVTAVFSSVAGLKVGASIEIAGVPVGKVSGIVLDPKNQTRALVTLQIDKRIEVTEDSIASIKTSGIIGDKYVNLTLGGGDALEQGEELMETESSIDLEALISKYVFGGVK